MSDRTKVLTVILDKDYRYEDAQSIITAVSMIKGVISVTPNVTDMSTHLAYTSARFDLEEKLWKALKEKPKNERD